MLELFWPYISFGMNYIHSIGLNLIKILISNK